MTTTVVPGGTAAQPPSALARLGRVASAVGQRSHWLWVAVLVVLVVFAVFGERLAPIDPRAQNLRARLLPPMSRSDQGLHLLGTDPLGRDLFGRVIVGTRLTFVIATCAMLIGSAIGVAAGVLAGYRRGWTDRVLSRVAEAQTAMPMFLIAILLVSLFGASIVNLILVLPTLVWPSFARIVRSETIRLHQAGFVEAAIATGCTDRRIMLRHVLPNLTGRIIALSVIATGQVILSEAGLSFLGAGVQPPDTTWGLLVADGREYLAVAWWLTIVPGAFLALTVLSLNLLGRHYTDRLGAAG